MDDSNPGKSLQSPSPAERTGKHPTHMWSLLEGLCKPLPLSSVEMTRQWAAVEVLTQDPKPEHDLWLCRCTGKWMLPTGSPWCPRRPLHLCHVLRPLLNAFAWLFFSHQAYYGHALEMPTALCSSPVTELHVPPPIHTHEQAKRDVTQLSACENGWRNKQNRLTL